MLSADSFWSYSLHQSTHGEAVTRILAAAIQAVEPHEVIRRSVERQGDRLAVSGRAYDLNEFEHIYLLAFGKASLGMAEAMGEVLGERLTAGLVVTKHMPEKTPDETRWTVVQGNHPIPGEGSLQAGKGALEFLSKLTPRDLLVCLISGGGSALVAAPLPGLSLEDLQALTAELLRCGATIEEINALRRRLDLLKGGGIVKISNGAAIVSLILSDVVGSPLESIASGPTAADPSTRLEVLGIIEKYGLKKLLPAGLYHTLVNSPEPPKPEDPLFERVQNVIVGSNLQAAQAALKQAEQEGFHPYLLRTDLQGEARQAAFELSTYLRQAKQTGSPVPAPGCIVAGGETTVTLRGSGRGGRNQELALAAVSELADFPGVMLITLATDGEDGPTDAAGAVVTGDSFHRAGEMGLNPGPYLEQNDSYAFFDRLGDLLRPGPTGTNVNDLVFLFTFPR